MFAGSAMRPLTPVSALALQRSVGNRAVAALLHDRSSAAPVRERSGCSGGLTTPVVVQRLNKGQKKTFREWAAANTVMLLTTLKWGTGRSGADQAANYLSVRGFLTEKGLGVKDQDVGDAVAILGEVVGRPGQLETRTAAPPVDAGRLLTDALASASDVSLLDAAVDVYLDTDQRKHQPKDHPIGTRQASGGNKFKPDYATPAWHRANTMVHMRDWALGLGALAEGAKTYHGQGAPVAEVHYEGYCLMAGGKKYVFFHCYPADGSSMKM